MTNPDFLTKLYQRMSAEQEQYRKWLLGQLSGEILNCSLRNQHTEMELDAVYFRDWYDSVGYLKKRGFYTNGRRLHTNAAFMQTKDCILL